MKRYSSWLFLTVLIFTATLSTSAQSEDAAYEEYLKLTTAAARACEAGSFDTASSLADKLLTAAQGREADWNYGNAIHVAHLVKGRAALAHGDMKTAEAELLASVTGFRKVESVNSAVKGWRASPQLDSFGPDMVLASEILAKGGTSAVLKYLDLCAEFWHGHEETLEAWRSSIREGRAPDFGPNLRYFFKPAKEKAR